MAQFTKKALMDSFLELIEDRPLNKITVKEITANCGVNRNTFYYHFQDIPQLIEAVVCEDAEYVISQNPNIESLEQCLDVAMSLVLKRKKVVYHIYHSTERAIFEHFLWEICTKVITDYYDRAVAQYPVSDTDKDIIIDYYKGLCFGVAILALERGLEEDMRPWIKRVCELKKNSVEEMIERAISLSEQ